MIVNSNVLMNNFIIKYINNPTEMMSKKSLEKKKYHLNIFENCDIFNDKNYSIILSNISFEEQRSFFRFCQLYIYKIYGTKKNFISNSKINWKAIDKFKNEAEINENFLLSCFHLYF